MTVQSELIDINLWNIIPILHCAMYAGTDKHYSLTGVPHKFAQAVEYLDSFHNKGEAWEKEELAEVLQLVATSNLEGIMAIEGNKGVIVRNAYLTAIASANLKTLYRSYMWGRDEKFAADKSNKEYELILRNKFTALGLCAVLVEKKQKQMFPVLGYLLTHYPLPVSK